MAETRHDSATFQLAQRIATTDSTRLPAAALEVGKQAILDFIGVTVAGMEEPLARMLRDDAREQGGHPQATVIGTDERVSVQQAALINGAAGHAHDYDDVQMAMSGHPTVPVAPTVLALAEHHQLPGADLLTAFVAGVDTECILGRYAGPAHYQKGWHATGTLGSFGAAAGASVLMGLDAPTTAQALGIAGTQAAGLKAQFGTMCKPLHAGHAAATGAQAASLAARGFSSRDDILEVEQGFMDTQAESADTQRFAAAMQTPSYTQDICFKYHAACYMTHSAIEATARLCESNAFDPHQIKAVTIEVDKGHFKVCNIQSPSTGLEAKFSLRFTTAMTLAGVDTSSIDIFTDELTQMPELVKFRDLISVQAHAERNPDTIVTIELADGNRLSESFDVAVPMQDLDAQWQKLTHKFTTLVEPRLGKTRTAQIVELCRTLDQQQDLQPLFSALAVH
ncbi:MAG: MmgE/PrpD family protein [Pseudomonadota bacterium]